MEFKIAQVVIAGYKFGAWTPAEVKNHFTFQIHQSGNPCGPALGALKSFNREWHAEVVQKLRDLDDPSKTWTEFV